LELVTSKSFIQQVYGLLKRREGKRPLGRWWDNTKIDLKIIDYQGVDWI
jgi:hypothetical protein